MSYKGPEQREFAYADGAFSVLFLLLDRRFRVSTKPENPIAK